MATSIRNLGCAGLAMNILLFLRHSFSARCETRKQGAIQDGKLQAEAPRDVRNFTIAIAAEREPFPAACGAPGVAKSAEGLTYMTDKAALAAAIFMFAPSWASADIADASTNGFTIKVVLNVQG